MRRLLFVLVVLLTVVAGACGSSDEDRSDRGATEPADRIGGEGSTTDVAPPSPGDEGSDPVAVSDWADHFCGAFQAWLDGVDAAGTDLTASIDPGNIENAKAAIVGLFDDVADQTETLVEELGNGGAPDIDDGGRFLSELVGRFEDFHAAITDARTEAAAVDTTDPVRFQATVTELVATFQAETESVSTSFSELDATYADVDLNAALASSCSFL